MAQNETVQVITEDIIFPVSFETTTYSPMIESYVLNTQSTSWLYVSGVKIVNKSSCSVIVHYLNASQVTKGFKWIVIGY